MASVRRTKKGQAGIKTLEQGFGPGAAGKALRIVFGVVTCGELKTGRFWALGEVKVNRFCPAVNRTVDRDWLIDGAGILHF